MAQILVRPGRPAENLSRATKAAAGVAWAGRLNVFVDGFCAHGQVTKFIDEYNKSMIEPLLRAIDSAGGQ